MKSELLATLRGGGGEFEYLVTVGSYSIITNVLLYGYGEETGYDTQVGSLYPLTITAYGVTDKIDLLCTVYDNENGIAQSAFNVSGELRNTTFHIGRSDTQQYLGSITANDLLSPFILFTADDVGKTIPVYIGITPPPYA